MALWLPKLTVPNKLQAVQRLVMVRCLSGILPLYIVNEYPKSGGSWVGGMLAEATGLPFPRNRRPPLKSCIMHGHYLDPRGLRNVVVVWRDGRDVLVSYCHHSMFHIQQYNRTVVDINRAAFGFADPEDIRANLPAFIEVLLTRPVRPHFSWQAFVDRWADRPGTCHVRYEDLRRAPAVELQRMFHALTGRALDQDRAAAIAAGHAFEAQARRPAGEERRTSFLRKGIVGDWRNNFSADAARAFDRHAGKALIRLGYEPDHGWVERHAAAI